MMHNSSSPTPPEFNDSTKKREKRTGAQYELQRNFKGDDSPGATDLSARLSFAKRAREVKAVNEAAVFKEDYPRDDKSIEDDERPNRSRASEPSYRKSILDAEKSGKETREKTRDVKNTGNVRNSYIADEQLSNKYRNEIDTNYDYNSGNVITSKIKRKKISRGVQTYVSLKPNPPNHAGRFLLSCFRTKSNARKCSLVREVEEEKVLTDKRKSIESRNEEIKSLDTVIINNKSRNVIKEKIKLTNNTDMKEEKVANNKDKIEKIICGKDKKLFMQNTDNVGKRKEIRNSKNREMKIYFGKSWLGKILKRNNNSKVQQNESQRNFNITDNSRNNKKEFAKPNFGNKRMSDDHKCENNSQSRWSAKIFNCKINPWKSTIASTNRENDVNKANKRLDLYITELNEIICDTCMIFDSSRRSAIKSYGNEKETVYVKSEDGFSVNEVKLDSTQSQAVYFRFISVIKEIFLPQGYPDSVHPDYTAYQIWDTVQAFASTIMGTLTTHSIMKGIGVGESSATPLAAAITWVLKNGTGMIGSIMFAWWNGTELDGQCKKWRLFADILNDMAMGIELLVPYFSSYSVVILCLSTIMKSIVGVAGGATRAALTQHQAIRNNLADVSAKDGSQETCVNLIASFFGIFILSLFHDGQYLIELYLFLVAVHIYANYSAVKALCLDTLNENRLALIVKNYMMNERVPEPQRINKEESILLGNPTKSICGFDIRIGVSFASVLKRNIISSMEMEFLLKFFEDRKYLITIDIETRNIFIILKKDIQPIEILEAYFYASICGLYICMARKIPIDILLKPEISELSYPLLNTYIFHKKFANSNSNVQLSIAIQSVCATDLMVSNEYKAFLSNLETNGWKTETNLLAVGAWRFSMGVSG